MVRKEIAQQHCDADDLDEDAQVADEGRELLPQIGQVPVEGRENGHRVNIRQNIEVTFPIL